jgi:ankyrin repeat protein
MLNVLDMAVLYNRVDLIDQLKGLDIDFNYSSGSLGHTALGVACYLGNINMIAALISSGAHSTGSELGLALKGGHIEVVEHVLSFGVKVCSSDVLTGIRSGASLDVIKV